VCTNEGAAVAEHRDVEDDVRDDAEMLISEERIRAGASTVPVGRARLQRVVVTERRTIEVDVRHEEIRVVQDAGPEYGELVVDDDRARATPWVVLREERIEVVRHLEPIERVRLVLEAVTSETPVTATVRHEVVDLEGDDLPNEG
jgi:stress response protein YsnF